MLPGVPIEADDTLNPETAIKFFKAASDAARQVELVGETLVRLRIWRGRLIALTDKKRGLVYQVLPCPECQESRRIEPSGDS